MVPESESETLRPAPAPIEPLDVPRWDDGGGPSGPALARATWALVALGVALRAVRYATNQPLWGDEGYLAASLIDRGFLDLLRPLEYYQVAPLFFLWVQMAAVRVLGFSEWTLRLFPVLCGAASVVVFAHVARRTLAGVPRLLAVAIFAGSFYLIRYATEAKPYATDLLVALVLIALAVEWWRDRRATRWLWALAAVAPPALGFSYPSAFVAGGISLALLVPVWRTGRRGVIAAHAALNLGLLVSFAALYVLVIRGQTASAGPGMHNYWAEAFPPPLSRPGALVLWLLEAHTSRMVAYPAGEAHGGSALTTLLALVGALALWRRGRRSLLALLLSPFPLALLAASLGRYPYGGSARTMQHIAPAVCLLAGLGAARLIGAIPRPDRRRRALRLAAAALAGVGLVAVGGDLARPYKFPEDERARRFARRFWVEQARGAELACVKRDLRTTIDPFHWETGRSAVYLCNQAIYSPRHHRGGAVDLGRVAADRPLRCVLYNVDRGHPDFIAWLERMRTRYRLRGVRTYEPVPLAIVGGLEFEDRYEVYEFVPRAGAGPASLARGSRPEPVHR